MDQAELKKLAAAEALKYVESGMVLGLGSGSTAAEFVKQLGAKLSGGELKDIVGVPTSVGTADLAKSLNIPLSTLDEHEKLDLAVDGADEVDPSLNMIKGLGKALLREKMTEVRVGKFVVIVDESKLVNKLGEKCPLPVEIVQFAHGATVKRLNTLPECRAELWLDESGEPARTDNNNFLAKCFFDKGIDDPSAVAKTLDGMPGVVEHGLFLGMATKVIVAAEAGIKIMAK